MFFRMKRSDPGACRVLALVIWAATCAGCSEKSLGTFLPNQPPTVRLTHAPVTTTSRNFYAYKLNWTGYDPDGTVDHYVYAVDPPNVDKPDDTWIRTTKNEETVFFRATTPDDPDSGK